ncbi:S-layer homology domain-containing protein [Paenibacillus sp. YYML68]|uniref:S-layer homology domain-containing protein n=1 Tax=Paenibacillus sp. YYML68 TaxID=2909250 RepID=UPI00249372B6|nr:S-layer homology domain-containing protein [Paenibacillus sp. YYML68]
MSEALERGRTGRGKGWARRAGRRVISLLLIAGLLTGMLPTGSYADTSIEGDLKEAEQAHGTFTELIMDENEGAKLAEAVLTPPILNPIPAYVREHSIQVTGTAITDAEVMVAVDSGNGYPESYKGVATGPSEEPGMSTFSIGIGFVSQGSYQITAYAERNGERSEATPTQTIIYDSIPPNAPAGVTANPGEADHIVLEWEPPLMEGPSGEVVTDPSIAYYIVNRNGEAIAETEELVYVDAGLPEMELFHYGIIAVDEAGNRSEPYPVSSATFHSRAVKIASVPSENGYEYVVASPVLSKDGRTVLFFSNSPNLPDAEEQVGIYVYDEREEKVDRLADAESRYRSGRGKLAVSADGSKVAFVDTSSNIVWLDRKSGITDSVTDVARASMNDLSLSADGGLLAFLSDADGIVEGDTDEKNDVFLYYAASKTMKRITPVMDGSEMFEAYGSPVLSGDGRYIYFIATSTEAPEAGPYPVSELFMYDVTSGTTERIRVQNDQGEPFEVRQLSVSHDGRYVAFTGGLRFQHQRIYIHDRESGETVAMYRSTQLSSTISLGNPSLSADGRYIALTYYNRNPVEGSSTGPFNSPWGAIRFDWRSEAYTYLGHRSQMTRSAMLSGDGEKAVFVLGDDAQLYSVCLSDNCDQEPPPPPNGITRALLSVQAPSGGAIRMGSSVTITATAGPGRELGASVTYVAAQGQRVSELALSERLDAPGVYQGTWTLPEGAQLLTGVRVKDLEDDRVFRDIDGEKLPLRVAGELEVTLDATYLSHLQNAFLTAVNANHQGASVRIDKAAIYKLALPAADAYTLSLRDARGALLLEQAGTAVVEGQRTAVTLSPVPFASLEVKVEGSSGQPIPGAKVRFLNETTGEVQLPPSTWEGIFKLPGTRRAGEAWRIEVIVPQLYLPSEPRDVVLSPGSQLLTVPVALVPDGIVEGVVTDSEGNPVQGVTVKLINYLLGGIVAAVESDQNGVYALSAPAGQYQVHVERTIPPLYQGSRATVNVESGKATPHNMEVTTLGAARVEVDAQVKRVNGTWDDIDIWERRTAQDYGMSLKSSNSSYLSQSIIYNNVWSFRGVAGDRITVCMNGARNGLTSDCEETVLDSYRRGSVRLEIEEKGRITSSIVNYNNIDFVNVVVEKLVDGKYKTLIGAPVTTGGRIDMSLPETGQLRLRIQKTLRNYNVPPYYPTAIVQYYEVEMTDGQLLELPPIVLRDQADLFYGVPGNGLLVRSEAMSGESVTLRGSYRLDTKSSSVTNAKLIVPVPFGAELIAGSVVWNGTPVEPIQREDGAYEIPIGNLQPGASGAVVYRLKLSLTQKERSAVQFAIAYQSASSAEQREEVVGRAYIYPVEVTMIAPGRVADEHVPVSGRAIAGSRVLIYSGQNLIGEAKATSGGLWSAKVKLPPKPEQRIWGDGERHHLTAVMEDGEKSVTSEPVVVSYDKNHPVVTSIKMVSQGSTYSFDPRNGVARFPFVADMGRHLLFEIQFNDNSRVSNVRVQFEKNEVPAVYVPAKDKFQVVTPMGASKLGGVYVTYDVAPLEPAPLPKPDTADLEAAVAAMPDAWRLAEYEIAEEAEGAVHLGAQALRDPTDGAYNSPLIKFKMGNSEEYAGYMRITARRVKGDGSGKPYRNVKSELKTTSTGVELRTEATISESLLTPREKAVLASLVQGHSKDDVDQIVIGLTTAFPDSLNAKVLDIANNLRSYVTDAMDFTDYADELLAFQDYVIANECHGPTRSHYINMTNLLFDQASTDLIAKNTITGFALVATHLPIPPILGFGVSEGLLALGNSVKNNWKDRLDELKEEFKKDQEWRDRMSAAGAIDRCRTPEEKEEMERHDKENLVADPNWIYDPSGYVYEAVPSNRLEGVVASLYQQDPVSGEWLFWDAEWYMQTNPLVTNSQGRYGWDVPEGKWRVQYEKPGYETAYSEELVVLPPHFDVNIPLVTYLPPEVEKVEGDDVLGLRIAFSKPMKVSTITDDTLLLETGLGEPVAGRVEAVGAEAMSDGTLVSKYYRYVPNVSLTEGADYRFMAAPGALSYSGVSVLDSEWLPVTIVAGDAPPKEAARELEAVGASRSMVAMWKADASPWVKAFRLYWRKEGAAEYGQPIELAPGELSYGLERLEAGVAYELKLTTVGANDMESEGLVVRAATLAEQELIMDTTPTAEVTAVTARRVAGQSLAVAWRDPSDADLRSVMVAWRKRGEQAFSEPKFVAPGEQQIVVEQLEINTDYQIQVSTVDTYWNESTGVLVESSTKEPANEPEDEPGSGSGGSIGTASPDDNKQTAEVGSGPLKWTGFEGAVSLALPEGVLKPGSVITVRKLEGEAPERAAVKAPLRSFGDLFRIDTDDEADTFSKPMSLTLRYAPDAGKGFDLRKLGIFKWDDSLKSWTYSGGVLDLEDGGVTTAITEPGVYALLTVDVRFADLDGHWSRETVEVLAARTMIHGRGGGLFMPSESLTRAEAVKLLVETMGTAELKAKIAAQASANSAAVPPFEDVTEKDWYFDYVRQATAAGWIQGDEGRFRPNDSVSREELAAMFIRSLGLEKKAQAHADELTDRGAEPDFADGDDISGWAIGYAELARELELMHGDSMHRFMPASNATRAEGAAILFRAMRAIGLIEALRETDTHFKP